jgi:nitric oxide reductase subunit C
MEVTNMRKNTILTLLIFILAVALVACGGGDNNADSGAEEGAATAGGDAARGEELYNQTTIGTASAPGCNTCHSREEGVVLVGPSHAGVATRAATYVEGQSAEEYLRESIVSPNSHIVDGFVAGVMYQNYGEDLTEQEIDDLVAYLLTLD